MATNEPSAYSWNTASKVPRASRLASEYKYRVQPKSEEEREGKSDVIYVVGTERRWNDDGRDTGIDEKERKKDKPGE
ncbi:LOW QUALITY PROTEIN: hypothetical protein IFM47457_07057 [Aspergillus lentulus]|nr:LOW QUALITY PROTEIN: hypothetical protein IFM47457_07057 [Aspergillus lentulus]